MCLISKDLLKISDKPIKIYKIVLQRYDGLYAPFQKDKYVNFPVIESKYKPDPFQTREQYQYRFGFIHAFLDKEYALHEKDLLTLLPGSKIFYIYEGVIPENTEYAVDVDGKTICARKIILIDRIV